MCACAALLRALSTSPKTFSRDQRHRVGKIRTGPVKKHRDIILKFATYNARNRLFNERKFLRETDNEDLKSIFLNEDLTKRRSEILFEARKLRRSNKLLAAYSSDGKIIVRDKKRQKAPDLCFGRFSRVWVC